MQIFDRVSQRMQRIRRTGWTRSLRIGVDRVALRLLQLVYGFHPWHANAPISARPYRVLVAAMVNDIEPPVRCVVEVGCGLGSILRLVRAPKRVGYDVDGGAVRAARFLNGRIVSFHAGDLTTVHQQQIDVLILVNWIHEFSSDQLKAWLEPLLSRTSFLLVDAIDPELNGYRFKHDFGFLNGFAREVQVARAPGEGRRFILFEVLE